MMCVLRGFFGVMRRLDKEGGIRGLEDRGRGFGV